jgi:hypothetical protein
MSLSQLTLLVLLILSTDDPATDVRDVSFLVMTHGFNVTERGIVTLDDGDQYQLIPNGEERGLARLEIITEKQK